MSVNKVTSTKDRQTVIIAIPCLLVGGTENQTLLLVRVLVKLNFRVVVACYFEWEMTVVEQFRNVGAIVHLFSPDACRCDGDLYVRERISGWARVRFLWHNIRELLTKYRPDIVHVQYMEPGLIPVLIFRILGVSCLYATVHQSGTPYGALQHIYLRLAAIASTRFTGISRHVLDSWFGVHWPRNVVLLYNAIDTDLISQIKAETDKDALKASVGIAGKQVIGTVARLSHIKGVDLLLDAFSRISEEIPDVVLVIVGDGNCRKELEAQAVQLGIAGRVIWMGKQSPDKAIAFTQMFDIAVCPSRYEGFGLMALEALVSGIPVVAFRVGGLPEVVEDQVNGVLVPPDNVQELARDCIRLLSDDHLRTKLSSQGSASLKYGLCAYQSAIVKLFNVSEKFYNEI